MLPIEKPTTTDDAINDFLLLRLEPALMKAMQTMPSLSCLGLPDPLVDAQDEAEEIIRELARYVRVLKWWMEKDGRVPPERSKLFPVPAPDGGVAGK